jgi:hypothetical protein
MSGQAVAVPNTPSTAATTAMVPMAFMLFNAHLLP